MIFEERVGSTQEKLVCLQPEEVNPPSVDYF